LPSAASVRSAPSSSVRKLRYVPPVENPFNSFHVSRVHAMCALSSSAFSHALVMLST
jgi:hypothetical protein